MPSYQPITLSTSRAVTDADSDATLVMSNAGVASTYTLPASAGKGLKFRFEVGAVNTSNYLIKVANATDTIDGSITMNQDGGDTSVTFNASGTDDTITLNGTTTGGVGIGDWLELQDIASGQWSVKGQLTGSGTEATPFSATVS